MILSNMVCVYIKTKTLINISEKLKRFYKQFSDINKKLEENGEPFQTYTKDEIKQTLYDWAERLVKGNCTRVSFEECQHNAEQDRLHFLGNFRHLGPYKPIG